MIWIMKGWAKTSCTTSVKGPNRSFGGFVGTKTRFPGLVAVRTRRFGSVRGKEGVKTLWIESSACPCFCYRCRCSCHCHSPTLGYFESRIWDTGRYRSWGCLGHTCCSPRTCSVSRTSLDFSRTRTRTPTRTRTRRRTDTLSSQTLVTVSLAFPASLASLPDGAMGTGQTWDFYCSPWFRIWVYVDWYPTSPV